MNRVTLLTAALAAVLICRVPLSLAAETPRPASAAAAPAAAVAAEGPVYDLFTGRAQELPFPVRKGRWLISTHDGRPLGAGEMSTGGTLRVHLTPLEPGESCLVFFTDGGGGAPRRLMLHSPYPLAGYFALFEEPEGSRALRNALLALGMTEDPGNAYVRERGSYRKPLKGAPLLRVRRTPVPDSQRLTLVFPDSDTEFAVPETVRQTVLSENPEGALTATPAPPLPSRRLSARELVWPDGGGTVIILPREFAFTRAADAAFLQRLLKRCHRPEAATQPEPAQQ